MATIHIETSQVDGIPFLTMRPEQDANRPLVFYLHGFTSDKRQGLFFGYELAKRGFTFVALDAIMHGDRFDSHLEKVLSGEADLVYPPDTGLDTYLLMHQVIVQTAEDVAKLRLHFLDEGIVATESIGVTGFSMGGFAAFYLATKLTSVEAIVPIAGIPAFEARWKDVILETSTYPKWSHQLEKVRPEIEEHNRFMQRIDPFEKLKAYHPRPVLMISGDTDTDSPKQYSLDLYRELQPIYARQPERLQMRVHDGVGHALTRAMIAEACDWFDRYL